MRCIDCHYDLKNLTGPPHRCPECGRAFNPDNASTYIANVAKRRARLRQWNVTWACILILHFALAAWILTLPALSNLTNVVWMFFPLPVTVTAVFNIRRNLHALRKLNDQ